MQLAWMVTGVLAALMMGYSYGRLSGRRSAVRVGRQAGGPEAELLEGAGEFTAQAQGYGRAAGRSPSAGNDSRGVVFGVFSPVTGMVTKVSQEGEVSVAIHPEEDRLYAPINGRIMKIYPMGNRLLLRTSSGTEVTIQVGKTQDDMLARCFRPRVVQNEVVGKGKLLLEFDRRALEAGGENTDVCLELDSGGDSEKRVFAAEGREVKRGEQLVGLRVGESEKGIASLFS